MKDNRTLKKNQPVMIDGVSHSVCCGNCESYPDCEMLKFEIHDIFKGCVEFENDGSFPPATQNVCTMMGRGKKCSHRNKRKICSLKLEGGISCQYIRTVAV